VIIYMRNPMIKCLEVLKEKFMSMQIKIQNKVYSIALFFFKKPVIEFILFLFIAFIAAAIYWLCCVWFNHAQPGYWSYFDHLAEAFLDGRLYLIEPQITQDLTLYEEKWYVPFPPMPALLMLPWIAVIGIEHFNAVFFAAVMGGINVALFFLLLSQISRQHWNTLSLVDNLWLTAFVGFGCVHWYMATVGSVWFIAQICTLTFLCLAACLAVMRYSPWCIGLALAFAVGARPHVLLMWPLLFSIYRQHQKSESAIFSSECFFWCVRSITPVVTVLILLLTYNFLRFDHFLDFGYLKQNVAAWVIDNLNQYGQFNTHFFAKNFWAMWLATPEWVADLKVWRVNAEGMSLLLTSPVLIYLLVVFSRRNKPFLNVITGAISAFLLISGLLLLYYNTGWVQFGYRFSLDFMVPLIVLLAFAAPQRVTCGMRILIVFAIQVNAYGVYWWHGS